MFWYFLSKVLKGANRLKVNIDDLLLYDKEKIKQDVYEIKRPIFFCYDVIELRWGYKIWMNLKNMGII